MLRVRWPVTAMATRSGTPVRTMFRAAVRRRSWTLPEGSSERAAGKLAAEQTAAELRSRAAEAGVDVTADVAEFNRVSGICRGRLQVMTRPDGTLNTLGTDSDRFRYEKCMQQQGQPVIWEK